MLPFVLATLFGGQPMPIPMVSGPATVQPHTLARFTVSLVSDKSAVSWRVTPSAGVSKATTVKTLLEFTAPPGEYVVSCIVVRIVGDQPVIDEDSRTVTLLGANTPVPPKPPGDPKTADPIAAVKAAVHRIQFGDAGCSATVLSPQRSDGRWHLLTAAHCVGKVGDTGAVWTHAGRKLSITVAAMDPRADLAVLTTDDPVDDLPCAKLAPVAPAVGARIFHVGFGVDKPRNTELGTVSSGVGKDGRIQFRMSVSHGDSGGGIALNESGEVVAAVCCTTAVDQVADVWGGSSVVAAKMIPANTGRTDPAGWHPRLMPIVGKTGK